MPKRLRHMMTIGLAVMAYSAAAGAQPTAPPTSSAPEAPATVYAPVNMDGRKLFEVPAPDVLVEALMASTVNLRLRFYTNSQWADYLKVGSECMRRVKEAFVQAHIAMPMDIQTVILQNAEALLRHGSAHTPSRQVTTPAATGKAVS